MSDMCVSPFDEYLLLVKFFLCYCMRVDNLKNSTIIALVSNYGGAEWEHAALQGVLMGNVDYNVLSWIEWGEVMRFH